MNKIECFKIRLFETDNLVFPFNINEWNPIKDVLCLTDLFSFNPTIIVADPFLFVHKDRLYLFYEDKGLLTPGVLKATYTRDLKHWSDPAIVLQESFHLSFPWVFEDGGKVYMIPETGADNSVRLYEAVDDDLSKFKLVTTLISIGEDKVVKMGYGDTCIIKKNNQHYLFTQIQYGDCVNTLELYVSDHLQGPYKVHASSPIQKNMKVGRNAGSIMNFDGKIIRFAQDCTNKYGDNVHICEINDITPTSYSESIIQENVLDAKHPFYKDGGHQFNVVRFKGKWIIATDAKEYHRLLLHKVIRKLYKYCKHKER